MGLQNDWMELLAVNRHGRRALTLTTAWRVALMDRTGWYVAPFSLGWTVGKSVDHASQKRYFHIVGGDDEPLFFETVEAALTFLRIELKVLRVPILNCGPVAAQASTVD